MFTFTSDVCEQKEVAQGPLVKIKFSVLTFRILEVVTKSARTQNSNSNL